MGLLLCATVYTPRGRSGIKDLASIAGVRANQLVGYGLVVGLDGTGDQTSRRRSPPRASRACSRSSASLPPGTDPQLKNVAAVSLSAELPPFTKPSQTIDVTVSTIGNARACAAAACLMAPLKGADGNVYAVAQGSLVVSGFRRSG